MNLRDVRWRADKPSIKEMMLLDMYVHSFNMAVVATLIMERVEPDQITEDDLLNAPYDLFYEIVQACIGNMPNPEGKYMYPDKTTHKEPYGTISSHDRTPTGRRTSEPSMQQDPEMDAKVRRLLGRDW